MRVTPEMKRIKTKLMMTIIYCNSERKGPREAISDDLTKCYYIYIRIQPAWSQFIFSYFQTVFYLILAQFPKTIKIYSLSCSHISLERRHCIIYIYYIRCLTLLDFFCSQFCNSLSPNLRDVAASVLAKSGNNFTLKGI